MGISKASFLQATDLAPYLASQGMLLLKQGTSDTNHNLKSKFPSFSK